MTTPNPRKDNPATNPDRQNGQGKHEGTAHKPSEWPHVRDGTRPDVAVGEDETGTGTGSQRAGR